LVFTAGVAPLAANGALVGAGDFIAQTVQVLSNLEAAQKEKRLPTVRKGTSQDTPCCSARNSPTGSTKRKAFLATARSSGSKPSGKSVRLSASRATMVVFASFSRRPLALTVPAHRPHGEKAKQKPFSISRHA
jgi:hypothetical protein